MRPGSGDRKYSLLISGRELEELKKATLGMAEDFGLGRRIERYQGQRPLGLYRWDLDCLEDVTWLALKDDRDYPDRSAPGYEAMQSLHERIKSLRATAYRELEAE